MERLKKILLVGASSLLLFCFPAFADELEASELPIEEVNHDIELVNDSTKEASEVSINNLAEIQGGMVKAPSVNTGSNFKYLGFETIGFDDGYIVSVIFEGSIDTSRYLDRFVVGPKRHYASAPSYTTSTGQLFPYGTNVAKIELPVIGGTYETLWEGTYVVTRENVGSGTASRGIGTYLSFVGQVFTWLLTTIGVLITFILGNPFLAVSLLLFMAGTVISFYIRIKNS